MEVAAGPSDQHDHQFIRGDALKALDRVADKSCRLIITSPPYNVGKEYERKTRRTIEEYSDWLEPIVEKICAKVTDDGHVCWQVGNYVRNGAIYPLDFLLFDLMSRRGFKLRNRIIWHFNFGLNETKRFSGRYETLLWFTKSEAYFFQLDPVRVPQLYPGKRHSEKKGARAGLPSGNPKGKNPSDFWIFDPEDAFRVRPIWRLPNVKAAHPEKTIHPCQFPSELVERCVLAMTEPGDWVLDPFAGVGTTVVAAAKHGRRGIGIEKSQRYLSLARKRLAGLRDGKTVTRLFGLPLRLPKLHERVSRIPVEWKTAAE